MVHCRVRDIEPCCTWPTCHRPPDVRVHYEKTRLDGTAPWLPPAGTVPLCSAHARELDRYANIVRVTRL